MTDEELDAARARQAWRIYHSTRSAEDVAVTALRLAREGWRPVDPDINEARECAAKVYREVGGSRDAELALGGKVDERLTVRVALVALKRGMILAQRRNQ